MHAISSHTRPLFGVARLRNRPALRRALAAAVLTTGVVAALGVSPVGARTAARPPPPPRHRPHHRLAGVGRPVRGRRP